MLNSVHMFIKVFFPCRIGPTPAEVLFQPKVVGNLFIYTMGNGRLRECRSLFCSQTLDFRIQHVKIIIQQTIGGGATWRQPVVELDIARGGIIEPLIGAPGFLGLRDCNFSIFTPTKFYTSFYIEISRKSWCGFQKELDLSHYLIYIWGYWIRKSAPQSNLTVHQPIKPYNFSKW